MPQCFRTSFNNRICRNKKAYSILDHRLSVREGKIKFFAYKNFLSLKKLLEESETFVEEFQTLAVYCSDENNFYRSLARDPNVVNGVNLLKMTQNLDPTINEIKQYLGCRYLIPRIGHVKLQNVFTEYKIKVAIGSPFSYLNPTNFVIR